MTETRQQAAKTAKIKVRGIFHASGMSLELYGTGQVLGVHACKGEYGSDEHENYRRLSASHQPKILLRIRNTIPVF